jgi:hypothetical protein
MMATPDRGSVLASIGIKRIWHGLIALRMVHCNWHIRNAKSI